MTVGTCEACGNEWSPRRDPDDLTDPKCPECGSRSDIEFRDDGPGFDPDAAVGLNVDELQEAVKATPGVGDAAAEYVAYWARKGVDGPEDLRDILLEVMDRKPAHRIVETMYGGDPDADAPPLSVDPDDGDADDGGESFVDKLAKAREAGLLGDGGGGAQGQITIEREDGPNVTVPADHPAVQQMIGGDGDGEDPMAEALETLGQQIQQSNRMLAEALKDGGGTSELEELKREIESLKEEKEREEIEELRRELRDLKGGAGDDVDALRIRKGAELAETAPERATEAIKELEGVAHSLMDRAKSLERQRAMMSDPRGGPSYTPPADGHGQQAPSPREAAANGHAARQDRRAEPQENSQPTDHDDDTNHDTTDMTDHTDRDDSTDDSDMTAEREPEGVTEEKAAEVRDKLGLPTDPEDADGEEVSA